MPKLVLDPGHGGKDAGAVGFGIKEADVVLKLAKLIGANLGKDEVEILLTRETDTFVELLGRAKMSNDFGADYFVSIHVNSATNVQANGFETYVRPGPVSQGTLDKREVIHTEIMNFLGPMHRIVDRGKKTANLSVLRNTEAQATLIEFLFISNAKENALLRQDLFLSELAVATATGVEKALGLTPKPEV
jgi:N-acetylmuramoyl-L-alanine amidase